MAISALHLQRRRLFLRQTAAWAYLRSRQPLAVDRDRAARPPARQAEAQAMCFVLSNLSVDSSRNPNCGRREVARQRGDAGGAAWHCRRQRPDQASFRNLNTLRQVSPADAARVRAAAWMGAARHSVASARAFSNCLPNPQYPTTARRICGRREVTRRRRDEGAATQRRQTPADFLILSFQPKVPYDNKTHLQMPRGRASPRGRGQRKQHRQRQRLVSNLLLSSKFR